MKWYNFTFLVKKGIHAVWHNRMMTFASFCVLLVSLLMVGLCLLAGLNVNQVLDYVEDQNEVLVFADGELEEGQINQIKIALTNSVYCERMTFRDKDATWAQWRNNTPEAGPIYGYIDDYMGDYNPMPHTFIVTINDLTKISDAVRDYSQIEGIYKVSAPHDFAAFLIGVRNTLTVIGGGVIAALIAICLVIIYNSARASVFSRRQEINIMKYVGATNSFVKTPFFIEGMVIGILAGAASWGLTKIAYSSIISMFGNDITLWQALGLTNLIPFNDISLIVLGLNCAAGAVLSAVGTIMSMGKHLKV